MMRMTWRAKNGVCWIRNMNRFSGTGTTTQSVLATAVAERGAPSTSAISPISPQATAALAEDEHLGPRIPFVKESVSGLIRARFFGSTEKVERRPHCGHHLASHPYY